MKKANLSGRTLKEASVQNIDKTEPLAAHSFGRKSESLGINCNLILYFILKLRFTFLQLIRLV